MYSWHSESSIPVATPGRTCSVIMSSTSAARRPAARIPTKSSGAWIVIRLASAPPSIFGLLPASRGDDRGHGEACATEGRDARPIGVRWVCGRSGAGYTPVSELRGDVRVDPLGGLDIPLTIGTVRLPEVGEAAAIERRGGRRSLRQGGSIVRDGLLGAIE